MTWRPGGLADVLSLSLCLQSTSPISANLLSKLSPLPSMGSISIYAELLLNIRQITVLASLPSASCRDTTRFTLSQDRQTLSVLHDGQAIAITLPAPVRASCSPTVLPGSSMVLSTRLPIMDNVAETLLSENHTNPSKSLWSAISMGPTTRIACRICQTLLVTEQVKVWKDLPSENWAEMMDFWHCHKPDTDEPSTHKQDGTRKGYGAANSIRPVSATGLIDITSFLLTQEDCNIIVSEDSTTLKVSASPCIHSSKFVMGNTCGNKKEACL